MDLLLSIIVLLVLLLVSNFISHYLPMIPTALTQIALGILFAGFVEEISFELEAEWFLLLFVAPLLFNDGRRFPRDELWKMRWPILANAFILVFLTTIVGGSFIHWLIPSIPLAAAFALAAILSPTDPVAVNGIAERIYLPPVILRLVRGESLINDASGLIAFNYAVAAVVTGYFSLGEAVLDFIYVVAVGAVSGVIIGLLLVGLRRSLRRQGIVDVTFYSLLQLVSPFIIYYAAEALLHASGVIAVVAAGIVHSSIKERAGIRNADEQVVTEHMWSIILFVLNGVVFLLLGLSIPSAMKETVENPAISNWLIIGYILAIGLVIMLIRMIWTYCYIGLECLLSKGGKTTKPSIKVSVLTGLTGVRGAITMAGVLSLPYFVASGNLFPERSLIIMLAGGIILLTLIAAAILLPLLSKREAAKASAEPPPYDQYKIRLLRAAVERIEEETIRDNQAAAFELIGEYKRVIDQLRYDNKEDERIREMEEELMEYRLIGLRTERRFLRECVNEGQVSQEIIGRILKSLDLREELLAHSLLSKVTFVLGQIKRKYGETDRATANELDHYAQMQELQIAAAKAAIAKLSQIKEESGHAESITIVIREYERFLARWKTAEIDDMRSRMMLDEQKEELRFKALEVERSTIQGMYEDGQINRETAKYLRRFINDVESLLLQETEE
ncbi:Na+/H+ antiporter [Pradoshia sp.]